MSTLPPTIKAPTYMKAHQCTLISRHQMHCTNSFSMIKIITTLSPTCTFACVHLQTHTDRVKKSGVPRENQSLTISTSVTYRERGMVECRFRPTTLVSHWYGEGHFSHYATNRPRKMCINLYFKKLWNKKKFAYYHSQTLTEAWRVFSFYKNMYSLIYDPHFWSCGMHFNWTCTFFFVLVWKTANLV